MHWPRSNDTGLVGIMTPEELQVMVGTWAIIILTPTIPFILWCLWMFNHGKNIVNNKWIHWAHCAVVWAIFLTPIVWWWIKKINFF